MKKFRVFTWTTFFSCPIKIGPEVSQESVLAFYVLLPLSWEAARPMASAGDIYPCIEAPSDRCCTDIATSPGMCWVCSELGDFCLCVGISGAWGQTEIKPWEGYCGDWTEDHVSWPQEHALLVEAIKKETMSLRWTSVCGCQWVQKGLKWLLLTRGTKCWHSQFSSKQHVPRSIGDTIVSPAGCHGWRDGLFGSPSLAGWLFMGVLIKAGQWALRFLLQQIVPLGGTEMLLPPILLGGWGLGIKCQIEQ